MSQTVRCIALAVPWASDGGWWPPDVDDPLQIAGLVWHLPGEGGAGRGVLQEAFYKKTMWRDKPYKASDSLLLRVSSLQLSPSSGKEHHHDNMLKQGTSAVMDTLPPWVVRVSQVRTMRTRRLIVAIPAKLWWQDWGLYFSVSDSVALMALVQ